ncbi:MAG: PEP-CTERM sorting domain-containing protein [Gemmatales bacterium]
MRWESVSKLACIAAVWGLSQAPAAAQSLPNYVIVERVGGDASFGGSGTAASNAATALFLDTFLPSTATQTLPGTSYSLPTAPSGSNLIMTDSGSATSNGYFTRFADGTGYAISGYNATVGTASVANSNPATITRTVGTLTGAISYSGGGSLNSSTGFTDGPSGNFRSVATVDGSAFYASTNAGIRYQSTPGSVTTTTQIVGNNTRNVRIQANTLFFSSSSGTPANNGIFMVGTAGVLPSTATAATQLPGLGTSGTGTPSAYSFVFFNNPLNSSNYAGTGFDTLYIADDRTNTSGGIQRWVFDDLAATWTLTGTFNYTQNANQNGARGLVATLDTTDPQNPVVQLWATSVGAASATRNDLFTLTDTLTSTGGTFGSDVVLATSPNNTFFRGVEIAAVPEPTTYALIGLTGLCTTGVWYQRRRKLMSNRFARV